MTIQELFTKYTDSEIMKYHSVSTPQGRQRIRMIHHIINRVREIVDGKVIAEPEEIKKLYMTIWAVIPKDVLQEIEMGFENERKNFDAVLQTIDMQESNVLFYVLWLFRICEEIEDRG